MDVAQFFSNIQHFGAGFLITLDPSKGEGFTESFIFIALVIVTGYLVIAGKEIPDFLKDLVIAITMMYIGFQSGKNTRNITN